MSGIDLLVCVATRMGGGSPRCRAWASGSPQVTTPESNAYKPTCFARVLPTLWTLAVDFARHSPPRVRPLCYSMSGTDAAYLPTCYLRMPGTDKSHLPIFCLPMSGTDIPHLPIVFLPMPGTDTTYDLTASSASSASCGAHILQVLACMLLRPCFAMPGMDLAYRAHVFLVLLPRCDVWYLHTGSCTGTMPRAVLR